MRIQDRSGVKSTTSDSPVINLIVLGLNEGIIHPFIHRSSAAGSGGQQSEHRNLDTLWIGWQLGIKC